MTDILLLGGTGFLGTSLLRKLEKNNSVKLMIHNSDLDTSTQKFKGNILSKRTFMDEIRDDETIINFLGQMTSNESDLINSNVVGGLNLLDSCTNKKIKQIILISSINVYGENLEKPSKETDELHPKTNYGLVKMITERIYEHFSHIYDINVTVLRLAGIYGPTKKSGFLNQIIQSVFDKKITPVCYNKGNQQRDILFIDDATDFIQNAINYESNGFNIFNISSGNRYSVNDLVSKIENITNSKISMKYSSEVPDERCIWADNSKAKQFLNFEPRFDIDSGLKLTIDGLK